MKILFSLTAALAFSTSLVAQLEIDNAIILTGGTGERYVTGLELPVNNPDAANKEYVDAAVSASGGGGHLHTLGNGSLPTMMSTASPTTHSYFQAINYCRNLVESGHSDWRLMTFDELSYMLSDDDIYPTIPNPTESTYFAVAMQAGPGNSSNYGRYILRFSDGSSGFTTLSDVWNTRCVR